jgi:hypothetical protein
MPRLISLVLLVTVVLAMAGTAGAQTAGRHHVVLGASNKVYANYDQCYNSAGPQPCISPEYTLSNYSRVAVSCQLDAWELNGLVIELVYYLKPNASHSYSFTTVYTGQTITLVMSCNGLDMPGQTRRIRQVEP